MRIHINKIWAVTLAVVLLFTLAGCGEQNRPTPQDPVTLTIWHTYVEGMQDSFNALVNEFNRTVGAKNGITIKVTAIANAPVINENLVAAANKDPGANALPDMAVVYPNVAVTLAGKGALVDLGTQFSVQELAAFVPQFLEEGRLSGKTLYILPIAKSTEVLYVNRTMFDRFAAATGVTMDQLGTFEGIMDAADKYYQWTDAKTPDIPNDGKLFYYPDNLFNYSMIGFQQLGGEMVKNQKLNLSDPIFQRVWDSYFIPAVKGDIAIFNDYGNYLAITGEVVCYTSTSAGASFCPRSVTYADNTKENVTFDVLPYPVFKNGNKVVIQRGGGICLFKSTPTKEYAAGVFLKWFTAPDQNLRFTAATGYMPVTEAAFQNVMAKKFPVIENDIVAKTLLTTADMHEDYRFYYPPVFDGFDQLQTNYVKRFQKTVQEAKDTYNKLPQQQQSAAALASMSVNTRQNFVNGYRQ